MYEVGDWAREYVSTRGCDKASLVQTGAAPTRGVSESPGPAEDASARTLAEGTPVIRQWLCPVGELPSPSVPPLPAPNKACWAICCCGLSVSYCLKVASALLGYRYCGAGVPLLCVLLHLGWQIHVGLKTLTNTCCRTRMASLEIPVRAAEKLCCPDSFGQSTMFSQMPRGSEAAGCVGLYPLSFPAWLCKAFREGLQVGCPALPPSLMGIHKAVLLYGRDPTDCLVGGNPLIGHTGRNRCWCLGFPFHWE